MSKKTNNKNTSKKQEENFIEEDNKVAVIVIAALTIVVGIIIGLLVGCQKNEEDKKPNNNEGKDIIIPTPNAEEDKEDLITEEQTIKTTVKKTSSSYTQTAPKRYYTVTFYYNNNQNSQRMRVEEGNKVDEFVPDGFESCSYNLNGNAFDFNTRITSNIEIIMDCRVLTNYKIIYHTDLNNDSITTEERYNVLQGEVAVRPYTAQTSIFDGWYTADGIKIAVINRNIVNHTNSSNELHLYPHERTYTYKVYNSSGSVIDSHTAQTAQDLQVSTPVQNNTLCGRETHLGWTRTNGSNIIDYGFDESITLEGDLSIYPVCGRAIVIYNSEGQTVQAGYTMDQLDPANPDGYNVPDTKEELEELGIETPTYYLPVENPTDTSKEVVEDTRPYIADNQITLTEVSNKAADGYTPAVGDNVEEIEKELVGWTTEDTDPSSPTNGEQISVEDNFIPPVDTETTLNAEWEEPIQYNPSSGI